MNQTTTILLLFVSLILSSCVPMNKGIVTFQQEPNDVFTKPSLKTFLADNPNPKIALRVPSAAPKFAYTGTDLITRPNMFKASSDIYNTIESEFLRAGFDVRDRSLFETLLGKSEATDYMKIQELTDTDLILELVSLNSNVLYETNTYASYKKGKERKLPQGIIRLLGAIVEFKVIMVNTNEVAGSYEFNLTPCADGCGFYISQTGALYRSQSIYGGLIPSDEIVESDALMEFIEAATQELIRNLK